MELKFNIADDKVEDYKNAYLFVHSNTEMIDDPDWVDPEDGTTVTQIAKYTDVQWVREHIMRGIKAQIVRGKDAMAKAAIVGQNANEVT